MQKLSFMVFMAAAQAFGGVGLASPAQPAALEPVADFYSGRDDLTTLSLGVSAFGTDGRGGVGINVFRKKDGSFVVQIIHDGRPRRRGEPPMKKVYVKAWKDRKNRICFRWHGKEYRTSSDYRY